MAKQYGGGEEIEGSKATERRISVSGPGLLRAVQEAHALRKQLKVVVDRDSLGAIIRLGYCVEPSEVQPPPITWFAPGEVVLEYESTDEPHFGDAKLYVDFSHDAKPHERTTIINVPVDDHCTLILRVLFRLRNDKVAAFVIQAEVKSTDPQAPDWKPVVRYDCAHGFVHRDMLFRDGATEKVPVDADDLGAVVPSIMCELEEKLFAWLNELGYPEAATENLAHPAFSHELAKAQEKLEALLSNPASMDVASSSAVMFSEYQDVGHVSDDSRSQ